MVKKSGSKKVKPRKKGKQRCSAITTRSSVNCTNIATRESKYKYCKRHMRLWYEEKQVNKRRCSANTQCDPENPGVKAILADDYPHTKCENCLKLARDYFKKRRSKDKKEKKIKDGVINCKQCAATLPENHPFKRCDNCLESERIKDQQRRDKIKEKNQQVHEKKYCLRCAREILLNEIVKTIKGVESGYCQKCFDARRKVENNRVKSDQTEKQREYENDPKIKAKRKEWRENNHDKVYAATAKYRYTQYKNNPEEFRDHNAETHLEYINNHPEKRTDTTERYRTNIVYKYNIYKTRAERCGYDFEISQNEFQNIIEHNCYYCNYTWPNKLNGIDRLNNVIGYVDNNVVSCCSICNYMKNTLNEATFILMCAHISTLLFSLNNGLYPKIFKNYHGLEYYKYKERAHNKNFEFQLSKKNFESIRNNACYFCQKETTEFHRNGIDRMNNEIGYIYTNCYPCCANCNYLKNDIDYDTFTQQVYYIAENHKNRLHNLFVNWQPSEFCKKNDHKLSCEERQELSLEKKNVREAKTLAANAERAGIDTNNRLDDEDLITFSKNQIVCWLNETKKENIPEIVKWVTEYDDNLKSKKLKK